jgi:superfamily II DNA or RNA helicase
MVPQFRRRSEAIREVRMARLFGQEYHEHSNTWYFRESARELSSGDLVHSVFSDEKGTLILTFRAAPEKEAVFPGQVRVWYDKDAQQVVKHTCSTCPTDDNCPHYLTLLLYAYQYLSAEVLERETVRTYQAKLLNFNEYWQRILFNSHIAVKGVFEPVNKIRFYFVGYEPIDIRLVSLAAADRDLHEEPEEAVELARRQLKAFSTEEQTLLVAFQQHKCSFSRAGNFFTIYKDDFYRFLPLMRNLRHKVFIRETGDRLVFAEPEFQLNFRVSPLEESDRFILRVAHDEVISAFFVNSTTYIFKKNAVHSLQLPFIKEVTEQVFRDGWILDREDLVYFASVVSRQLSILKCYLDFHDSIKLPDIFDTQPGVAFHLWKRGDRIVLEGRLEYNEDVSIPMSVLQYPTDLIRLDQNDRETWFYILPQLRYQIRTFLGKLPPSMAKDNELDAELVFEGEENIDQLKKTIFEDSDPQWNIVLSEELRREFVYKVNLRPVIQASASDEIDWFQYEVAYRYKDVQFTHEELRAFFASKQKFMKLTDGRLLYFANQEAFHDVESLMKRSRRDMPDHYKMSVYNVPFLFQMTGVRQGVQISGDGFLQNMYQALINRRIDETFLVPSNLQAVMRTYQKAGFQWLKMLQKYHLHGVLADDMGLGKTIQAISILADLPVDRISLVVCPKTLLYNWAAEIDKFNPSLKYIVYEGSKENRTALLEQKAVQVIIASYSIILNDRQELRKIPFEYIILDEAQHIKNSTALRTKAIKELQCRRRLALTGTPMENSPTELWSIFDFLLPGYLPPLSKFKSEYVAPSDDKRAKHRRLASLISPFLLRRKKREVLIELPDKQEQISYCRMSPVQEKLYMEVIEAVRKTLLPRMDHAAPGQYIHVLAALTKLRQVCNHPALVNRDLKHRVEFSGKMENLVEILEDAVSSGRKVLVFSQFVEMLQLVRDVIKNKHIPYEYMDGSTRQRQKHVDNFNNNNQIRVFLISLKTGGFGLNLTAADTVILVDPWWNPMGENQAIDRAHRIGQTKKVNVYKLITKGAVEEKILSLQKNKIELFESIVEDGQGILKNLTTDELKGLFEY